MDKKNANRFTKKVQARMESGAIIEQKCWQYIKEVNGKSAEKLDLVALTDCRRDYTYRQMYDMWDRYARVFSALGITEGNNSRAGVDGTVCSETVFAFFALNMTGASVSMILLDSKKRLERLKELVRKERITDLVLTDYETDASFLRQLLKDKDSMGIRNVVLLHVPVEGDFAFAWEEIGSRINYKRLKEISGAVFMEDLLREYRDHEICFAGEACSASAVIAQSSGTTEGVPKPVPFSDRGLNETLRRHTVCGKTAPSNNRMTMINCLSRSIASEFIGTMTPLANGGHLIAIPTVDPLRLYPAAEYYHATNIVMFSVIMDLNFMLPVKPDLSSVETALIAGAYVSAETVSKCRKFMKECGSHANVLVGYGLAEAGVGLTLTDPDTEDDSVGHLLPGIKAKLWDEDKECFHDIDGKEHTGVLFVSTPSVSSGRLDDDILFELEDIDGEKYLNTHDLFRAQEDGALYYLGRMNKFFMNSAGVRFEAGLVERALSAQKGIKSCGFAPEFNKDIHDTVPVLYAETDRPGRGGYRIVKDALEKVYIRDGLIDKTALPAKCVLTDDIPRTMTGKVDVHKITNGNVRGDTYNVEGVYEGGKLVRIDLPRFFKKIPGIGCDMFPCAAEDESGVNKAPASLPDGILERLESGEIIEQKIWKFIKELNSYSDERLAAIALSDSRRDYTYRQLFGLWEKYAGAFSALGMTGENRSRVAMTGTCAVEAISAFFALNMTGASVSMICFDDFNIAESWEKTIRKENITDVILTDIDAYPAFVRELANEKEKLGIRNIIILNVAVFVGEQFSPHDVSMHRKKRDKIKQIGGLLFMEDLLKEHGSHPVSFCKDGSGDAAVILHTTGTVSGIHKPVPHSDAGINEAVARILRDDRFKNLIGRAVTCSGMDMALSYAFIDQIMLILTFGGRLHVRPAQMPGIAHMMSLIDNNANLVFFAGMTYELLDRLHIRLDLSSFEHIIVGGSYVSADTKKRFDRFLKRNGAKSTAMIGYGISEAGAACILAPPGREDDAIGYPLPGVKVRLYDENDGKYYGLEDGPRTGVLHISSRSVSDGRIDDTVFFELEDIDGEKYLNTYDLVRVGEDGALYYAGRMNKYFVNNEGVRFDAGLVETAVSAEPGIAACGLAPEYNKALHDSIPVLYVQTAGNKRYSIKTVRDALVNVFVRDNAIKKSNLPSKCVITDNIPLNEMGKVDTHRLGTEEANGKRFSVLPVKTDGVLRSVELVPIFPATGPDFGFGVPEELEATVFKAKKKFEGGLSA